MEKSIYEGSHEAIRAYLRHRGVEILEESWEHGSDSINFIAMDDGKLVFADTATKCGGYDVPKEEPDQKSFERMQRHTSPEPRWRVSSASATTS